MFRTIVILAILFRVFTNTYAQSLTSQCLDAWKRMAADPASGCISAEQALPIATAIQNNASIVPIMNNWFTHMCNQPACSNRTITAVHNLLLEKCSDLDTWSHYNPTVYPTWRKVNCLKNSNGTLCLTEHLTNVESYSGTVTFSKFQHGSRAALPANITCTDCQKAEYSIWASDIPSSVAGGEPALQSLCGATFVDGKMPTGITQSANNATSTAAASLKGLAFGRFPPSFVGMAWTALGFIVISTVYMIVA